MNICVGPTGDLHAFDLADVRAVTRLHDDVLEVHVKDAIKVIQVRADWGEFIAEVRDARNAAYQPPVQPTFRLGTAG